MTGKAANTTDFTVTLTEEERAELLALVHHTLGETRVEAHHTHTPAFREGVLNKEVLLKELIKKLAAPAK